MKKEEIIIEPSYVPWSPLPERPQIRWPDGSPVAVCIVVHLEHVEYWPAKDTSIPPWLVSRGPYPNIPYVHETTSREYGNRVGVFRVMEQLDRFGIRATAPIDAYVAEHYRAVTDAAKQRNWEFLAHAPVSSTFLTESFTEEEERAYLSSAVRGVHELTGRAPRGWAGVDYGGTSRTMEILHEQGLDYVCGWPNDEQPYRTSFSCEGKEEMVVLPVSIHLDDAFAHPQRGVSMDEWELMVYRTFERLVTDGAHSGRVLVLGLRPWLIGQPFRIGHLAAVLQKISDSGNAWFATGEEIVDAFTSQQRRYEAAAGDPRVA